MFAAVKTSNIWMAFLGYYVTKLLKYLLYRNMLERWHITENEYMEDNIFHYKAPEWSVWYVPGEIKANVPSELTKIF